MPKIFDNIDQHLLPTLSAAMGLSERGDFCVGYFNLRGWRQIDEYVERWDGGERHCCRLLVGMQKAPEEQLRSLMATSTDEEIDNAKAIQLKRQLAQEFRQQLTYGIPTAADEAGLRRLAEQINTGKLVVKLFVRHQEFHPAHAKPVTDDIDRVFAKHYGFTQEEIDFVVNYDIKYRVGAQEDSDEE